MKRLLILCEGVTDQIFIADCIENFYGTKCKRQIKKKNDVEKIEISFDSHSKIVEVGGCSKLVDPIFIAMMEDNSAYGGTNLIVFDADFETEDFGKKDGNNGFKSCARKIEDIKNNNNLDIKYYLWPDNSQDGTIENLLRKLIPKEKQPILDCIENHGNCIRSLGLGNLKVAGLKEHINYYLFTSGQKSESRRRDYQNSAYWNLNLVEVYELKLLKMFLDEFISVP